MALTDSKGAVPARKHKLERSNIEQAENELMTEKRLAGHDQKFPRHVHKPGGLYKEVTNEDELAAALEKGWHYDLHKLVESEPREMPTKVSEMTEKQAKAFIAEHGQHAEKLVEIRADEEGHGNRPKVMALIDEAMDNFTVKPAHVKSETAEKPTRARKTAAPKKK